MQDQQSLYLSDVIDCDAIQSMLEDFYSLLQIPAALVDMSGRMLVRVGCQDICAKFHRTHPDACHHCLDSNLGAVAALPPGECRTYRCKNHVWDVATPIECNGQKVGLIFTGQFFFDDDPPDLELFREQARCYGFPEQEYLDAVRRVPRLSRERVAAGTSFLRKLAAAISQLSYNNHLLRAALREREALAESLRQTTDILNRAEQIARLGSWSLDIKENRLSWSDEVYRIFGLEPQQFGATYEAFLDRVHPEDRLAVNEAYLSSVAEGRSSYDIFHRIRRNDTDEVRWVHEKCENVRDGSGEVVRSFGIVQDVTEIRRVQEDLQRNNRELTAANGALEEFAYAVSHDLKEPLRMVKIYTQALLRRSELGNNPEAQKYAEFVNTGVSRMQDLTGDLLLYTQTVHQQQTGPATGPADLNESLRLAMAVLQPQMEQCGLTINSVKLPVVSANEGQMAQVFQNLLSNSIKYARLGEPPVVTIAAELRGTEWVVTVHDNGLGFDPVYHERIFGLFKRLYRDEYPGTGLGLAICRRIIERFGGRIWASSGGEGRGAQFSFALQQAGAAAAAV